MDTSDWYEAEFLVKERLNDLRRTGESLRLLDKPARRLSLRVVVPTTLARLAAWLRRTDRPASHEAAPSQQAPRPVGHVPAGKCTRAIGKSHAGVTSVVASVGRTSHETERLRCPRNAA
jgi:hypothetical protein